MKLISKWKMFAATLAMGCALLYGSQTAPVVASDHDDGETNIKSRNLSLTDLYVFREDWHSGNVSDEGNLVFVMNTNPRSLPRQHYFFNTEAVYSFHVSPRGTDPNSAVNGADTMRFDFRFGPPDPTTFRQSIQMDVVRQNVSGAFISQATVTDGLTTTAPPLLGDPNPAPFTNNFTIDGAPMKLFAGLREDPFFFDVEAFFRVRAGAAGGGPAVGFAPAIDAVDFAQGYNVNAVVLSVPISFLQSGGTDTIFDVWESVSIPDDLAARQ